MGSTPPVVKTVHVQDFKLNIQTRDQTVFFLVVCHVPIVDMPGLPQIKGVRHILSKKEIKYVKGASCVDLCLSGPHVQSVRSVVAN